MIAVRKFGLLALAVLLIGIWIVSWLVLKITSGLIHLLVIFAVISAVLHFLGRRGDT